MPNRNATSPAAPEFVTVRTFDAPRDLVFAAWTDPERLKHWWGAKGCTTFACDADVRPGGLFHYGMRTPNGQEMWGKWTYREVVAPERLVFVASFSDPDRNATRHPLAPDWPLEVLSTLTFTENAGRTTITMHGTPLNATDAECRTFEAAQESLQAGWKGTLDRLDEFLARR